MLSGPGFSELLRPDIVGPLLDELQLEERLAPYLPEVHVFPFLLLRLSLMPLSFVHILAGWHLRLFLGVVLFDI